MSQYTRGLAEYIAGTKFEDLPQDVVEHTKLLVLDTVGAGLLGVDLEWSERLRDGIFGIEGNGDASVWGTNRKLSAPAAAMVNGTAIHGFEIDDVGAGGHNGSVTLPSIMALAEHRGGISGKDLINAVVTGIETASRVGNCVGNIPHTGMGFHGPGLMGTFAAAASAARTLQLTPEQVVDTLGTAGQQAASLMFTHHGGMGKRLLAGQAARNGVTAAVLSGAGFTNADNVFEAEYGGFPSAHTGNRGPEYYDLTQLTKDLGTVYNTRDVNFKMWACRVPNHPTLEGIKELRLQHPFTADDVAKVRIRLAKGSFQNVGWKFEGHVTVTSSQLNIYYVSAMMLLEGDVSIEQFGEDKLHSKAVADMIARIEVIHDPALDQGPERADPVEIELKDGTVLKTVGRQRTTKHNAPTLEDVMAKFRKMTARRLSTSAQDAMIAFCKDLESVKDATELVRMMCP